MRIYDVQLECGCLVSVDEGGGLIPCSYGEDNPNCKAHEYLHSEEYKKHWEKINGKMEE